jgi:hypothetical protein
VNRLDKLRDTLFGFVDQSDDLLLVIDTRDLDVPIILKTIESVDRESPADIFSSFGQIFESGPAWADAAMHSLGLQMQTANLLRQQDGLEAWDPLPSLCLDSSQVPGDRVRAAMVHVRGLFPLDEDHRMIWSLLPSEIRDVPGYLQLVSTLLPWHGYEPWMQGQRLILRDDKARPFLIPQLRQQFPAGVLVFDADLGPEAMADDLVAAAKDPETPEQERMTSLLQLAGLDLAYGRHPDAIEKYGVVFAYFERQQRPALQAVCLGGVGDVLVREQQLGEAKQRYQQALALASQGKVEGLPITMILSGSIGNVCMARREFEEAEGYFGVGSEVAGGLVNIQYKADMMEKIGLAREAQGKLAEAIEIWKLARDRCADAHYLLRWRSVLDNLARVYAGAGRSGERAVVEDERAVVQATLDAEGWPS